MLHRNIDRSRFRVYFATRKTGHLAATSNEDCHAERENCAGHRLHLRVGLAIARALAKDGANIMLNGFGEAAAIEKERAGLEMEFGVKAPIREAT